MLHEIMLQAALIGGDCVLVLLLLASVVSVGIVSGRVWFFVQHRVDADAFARNLLQALHAGDWNRARSLTTRSTASVCIVVTAGLTQAKHGLRAIKLAMRSARSHEQLRLVGSLGALGPIAQATLLLGLLGTLFDLMQLSLAASSGEAPELDAFSVLGPAAAGILVAVPALLAAGLLKAHMRRVLWELDSVADLVLLQMNVAEREAQNVRPAQAA